MKNIFKNKNFIFESTIYIVYYFLSYFINYQLLFFKIINYLNQDLIHFTILKIINLLKKILIINYRIFINYKTNLLKDVCLINLIIFNF